mgnify:CR=1 FL=1|jgi:hypothetical protein
MTQESITQLKKVQEYLIEDMYSCYCDIINGEPQAEVDLFQSLQRLKTFSDAVQGLEAVDGLQYACESPA